ncbi:MAG: C25 family cysteine peptidase [Candidatus Promineifilaceae bacterium]
MVSSPISPKANLSILVFIFIFLAITFSTPGTSNGAELPSGIQEVQSDAGKEEKTGIKIVLSDETGLVFEVSPPDIIKSPKETDSGRFDQVRIPGYGYLGIDGHPDLPQTTALLAIPPGAVPEITILEGKSQIVEGVRVLPAARQVLVNAYPDLARDISDFVPEFDTSYPADEKAYSTDEFFPANPVELGDIFWLRDRQVVRVHVRPVLANSDRQTLKIYSHLTLKVAFNYPYGAESLALETRQEGSAYESTLSESLLNFEESRGWRMRRIFNSESQTSPCMVGSAFRLSVGETGMYEVAYSELSSSGWPSDISVDDIRMCYKDAEVAIRIEDGNNNDFFDDSDSLIFYGQAIKTQETTTNVYWLSYYTDGSSGKRMVTDSNSAGGVTPDRYQAKYHLEEDAEYYSSMPMSDDNDHWYWRKTLVGQDEDPNQSMSTDLYFPNPVTGDGSSFPLRVKIWAYFRPEWHLVEVWFNNQSLEPADFYGSGAGNDSLLYEADVPSSYLNSNGSNTITVVALPHPGIPIGDPPHRILIDWMEVEPYRYLIARDNHLAFRLSPSGTEDTTISAGGFGPGNAEVDIYDVTNPENVSWQPRSASGGSVSFRRILNSTRSFELATAGAHLTPQAITADTIPSPPLSDPANEADMIIITDPSLNDTLTLLRSWRSSQGLVVKTVFVQDIFDEFSFGLYSTEAIKDFLSYAYENWSGSREYVLLAGEGSYDHRDILGLNGPGGNLVPVYLRSGIDRNLGEAAADNQYVDIDGDDMADMMLGRLPARNSAELAIMVDKILAYEAGPITAPWRARHLFVTDNGIIPTESGCYQDPAADFFAAVNGFITDFFPSRHLLHRMFYAPHACSYGRPASDISTGGWTASAGTGLYEMINEVTASDDDYIEADSSDTAVEVKLWSVHEPTSSLGHTLRFRAQSIGGGGEPEKLDVVLIEGAPVITKTFTINRGSFQTYNYTLSMDEADDISDYTKLQIHFIVDSMSTGENIRVSWAEFFDDPEPYFATTVPQMQTGIVQKYNAGNQFVVYTGHSGTREWGHESFFNLQLANGIANGGNTPIMLPMTCLVGIYHFPQGDNLSETLLKLNNGGSVASFAPTGLQVQNGHDYLLKGFYSGIFTDDVRTVGQAVFVAKLNLDSGPSGYQDLHDTFMLLGDPAMRIDMPDGVEQSFLPVTTK